jgi:glycosyltransferase involved in cell wall biosynthesis
MRVIHLATSLDGGAGIAALRINEALKIIGVESEILSRNNFFAKKSGLFKLGILKKLTSSVNTLFQSKIVQKTDDLVTPQSISVLDFKLLDSADLIHVHSYYNLLSYSDIMSLTKIGKPVFFTMHDQRLFTGGCHYSRECNQYLIDCSNCPQVNDKFKLIVSRSFLKQKAAFANAKNITITSPSIWLKKNATESQILNKIPIHVVKNPIPRIYFEHPINLYKEKDSLKIAFIATNLLNPYKGLDVFIKSLNKLVTLTTKKITVVVAGHGDDIKFDARIIVERVIVKGDSAMAKFLSTVDILVVPSTQDNSPSVIGEALSMGVTVIGSNTGGITEILTDFEMPIFPVNDHENLATIILNLKQVSNRSQIREKSKYYFSEEIIANKLLNLYSKTI